MGFDFQMINVPTRLSVAEVKQFAGYLAISERRLGAFRFNVSPMPALVSALVVSGVASAEEPGEFPHWPPGGMDEESAEALAVALHHGRSPPRGASPAEVEAMKTFLAQRQRVLSACSSKMTQVPLYKFQGNEGWVVTPEECKAIAAALAAHLDLAANRKSDPAFEREWTKELLRLPERFRPVSFEQEGPLSERFRERLKPFIEFNLLAAAHGGYTVN